MGTMGYIFIAITIISIVLFVYKKRAVFLTLPFITIFVYFAIQVFMVPMSFVETIKFIFSLR